MRLRLDTLRTVLGLLKLETKNRRDHLECSANFSNTPTGAGGGA